VVEKIFKKSKKKRGRQKTAHHRHSLAELKNDMFFCRQSKFEKCLHLSEAKQSHIHFLEPTQSVITQVNAMLF
jgi:hypothetical protein